MAEFESCSKCKFDGKSTHEFPCNECVHNAREHFRPKSQADKIRAMSDEELTEFLKKFDLCTNCKYGEDVRCTFGNPCTHGFATAMAYEWLKSEVKE